MRSAFETLRTAIFPVVPEAIRDDFTRLTASQLQSQSRLLFLALFITVPTNIYAASSTAPQFIRLGLPIVMGTACLIGFIGLLRDLKLERSIWRSRKLISNSTWVSSTLATVCSAWCVFSWLTTADEARIYYPLILSMGSLSTAYCLASIRVAAIANIVIGITPISLLLLFSGNRMDLAAATSLIIASAFLLRLIVQQHKQLVAMLMLQKQMRELADTDPLTGLLNRRALNKQLEQSIAAADESSRFVFALLDLDGFKPVNDRYGHATGDMLLCEVAERLRQICGEQATVARMGGDEFALFVPVTSEAEANSMADRTLSALIAPCKIGDHLIRVGASIGVAHWPADGNAPGALYETADVALYAAKASSERQTARQTKAA